MALKIFWTKRADKKFDKLLDYLHKEYGSQRTEQFVKRVFDFMEILSEYPKIGSIENESKGIRGFTLEKQVNVFYRISEKGIIILNFFDNRQSEVKKKF
jgi:plasmid stabilization system protein ParE